MKDIMLASGRALRSLREPRMLWHLLWPALLATLVWLVLALSGWSLALDALMAGFAQLPWLGGWMAGSEVASGFVRFMSGLTLAFALLPAIYITATMLVSAVAVPLMLEKVGRSDYPDVVMRRGGSNLGSLWNSIAAGVVFVLLLLLSLPLWLIPGAGLVISVLLTGWLNRKAFGYDALMLHADRAEMAQLRQRQGRSMLTLGWGCALVAHAPVLNLLAPGLTGLAFVHFLLESLRRARRSEPDIDSAAARG